MTDAMDMMNAGGSPAIRSPVIFGASPTLVRVFTPDELPERARQLPAVRLPAPLRLLTHRLHEDWTDDRVGRAVLLEHDDPDVAAAVVVGLASGTNVPLIWISARELVSSELAFPQRAMNAIVRFAVDRGRAVLYVHDFDAIARPRSTYPSHYARRATHDVLAAMRTADSQRGELMLVTSASPGMLDRSLVIDRFDVAIHLDIAMPPATPVRREDLPDVA
jgi:ATPase family associated with various cellular activities (AAA)